jgi:phage baseplate assembly protein V
VLRAIVHRVSDAGETQVVDVEAHEGMLRSAVEVLQTYGLASAPPDAAGALAVVLAIGGDQGDLVVLPLSAPHVRFGALAPGEVALYDARGNRVHLKADGTIEVRAATKVVVQAPLVQIEASAGVEITGDLRVSGQVQDAAGTMQEMRDRYNAHNHGGAGPTPLMD